jgi:hypothetical protein
MTHQVLGSPDEAGMAFVSSDKARRYLRSLPQHKRRDLKQLLPGTDDMVRIWQSSIFSTFHCFRLGHFT